MNNHHKNILVIEDEPAILRVISAMLRREGFNVFTAKDGKEGITLVRKYQPHLVVLDIVMPEMDGITMLKQVRSINADQWGKTVKVIVYTNLSYVERRKEAEQVGINDFLIKSDVGLSELVANIKEKMGAS